MRRLVSTPTAFVCALAFFATFNFFGCGSHERNGGTMAGPTPTPIECVDNSIILNAVYQRLKAEGVENQFWQFNITADGTRQEVRITGWSNKRTDIIGWVKDAVRKCSVKDDSFASSRSDFDNTSHPNPLGTPIPHYRVGCPPNYTPCGDICIPSGDTCKLSEGAQTSASKISCTAPESKPNPAASPSKTQ